MQSIKERSVRSYALLDELFIWGIILAPMTALRMYKFGPGEILLIMWMIAVFIGSNPSTKYHLGTLPISPIGKYQITNIVVMMFGMFTNILFYHASVKINVVATNAFSHLFMFLISSCMVLYFEERELDDLHKIIRKIVLRGVFIYGLLLIYATYFSTRLFGINLWLGGRGYRFLGLALNPHQIGMITGSGLCFALYLMSVAQSTIRKGLFLVVAELWIWISLSLRSDTLTITYVVLTVAAILLKIMKNSGDDPELRTRNNFAILAIFVILVLLNASRLWSALTNFVVEAGNGLGRIELWQSGLGQFQGKLLCLFTGLGPSGGTGLYMASGNEVEAHNTYVQQILNSGVFICLYYVIMVIGFIKKPTQKNTYLVAAVLYFVLYGFGGNMNRRVLVWFTYTMVMILTEKTKDTEIANK